MGTRADFYIKSSKKMTWIGSIGWDGYPEGIDSKILKATKLEDFKREVGIFLKSRKDATFVKEGWPWPWKDSNTTDYVYVLDVKQKQVFISNFGCPFHTYEEDRKYEAAYRRWLKKAEDPAYTGEEPEFERFLAKIGRVKRFSFPDMQTLQKVKLAGPGSGLIVIGAE